MIVKIKDKEYSFDGYVNSISSVQKLAEEIYQQGRADVIEELQNKVSKSAYSKDIQMISMDLLWEILKELKEQK